MIDQIRNSLRGHLKYRYLPYVLALLVFLFQNVAFSSGHLSILERLDRHQKKIQSLEKAIKKIDAYEKKLKTLKFSFKVHRLPAPYFSEVFFPSHKGSRWAVVNEKGSFVKKTVGGFLNFLTLSQMSTHLQAYGKKAKKWNLSAFHMCYKNGNDLVFSYRFKEPDYVIVEWQEKGWMKTYHYVAAARVRVLSKHLVVLEYVSGGNPRCNSSLGITSLIRQ